MTFHYIRAGSLVTILTPQGQERKGRAVMRGPHGWVLNMGGAHGTPGIATPANTVKVKSPKKDAFTACAQIVNGGAA